MSKGDKFDRVVGQVAEPATSERPYLGIDDETMSELQALSQDNDSMQLAIHNREIQTGGFLWTSKGLEVVGAITQEGWEYTGKMLGFLDSSLQWLIGDWLTSGEASSYGDMKTFAEQYGFEYDTIKDYAYVSRNVEMSVRTDILSFGHHKLVASMDNVYDQSYWLSQAITNKWSIAKLRGAIKKANGEESKKKTKSYRINDFTSDVDNIYTHAIKFKSGDKLQAIDYLENMLDKLRNS